jgi:regulatory protein
MSRITAIRADNRRTKRVKVFLDGGLVLSLGAEMVQENRLQVGQELSDEQVESLSRSDNFCRCMDSAAGYLSYRPRSESELRVRLKRRGFEESDIEAVVTRLKAVGLVDDRAFTEFWKENREVFSPRSQQLTRLELRRKGVEKGIIDGVVGVIDESDSAYRAALGRAGRLPLSDYKIFHRWLGDYLRRRGFNYDIINSTVKRVWLELGGGFENSTSL